MTISLKTPEFVNIPGSTRNRSIHTSPAQEPQLVCVVSGLVGYSRRYEVLGVIDPWGRATGNSQYNGFDLEVQLQDSKIKCDDLITVIWRYKPPLKSGFDPRKSSLERTTRKSQFHFLATSRRGELVRKSFCHLFQRIVVVFLFFFKLLHRL